jgi:hypothetical protein
MAKNTAIPDSGLFPPEDRQGFAVPVSPSHSLLLLNNYMRTDLLLGIHRHVHRVKEQNPAGSPIHHLADSIAHVVAACRRRTHAEPEPQSPPPTSRSRRLRILRPLSKPSK